MKILILEDEPKILELLSQGFSDAGFETTPAADGEMGLQLALTGEFDLLIVDVMLPQRDGFSVVKELRQKNRQVPVLFLSAKRSTEDRIEGLKLGGDDYIIKPFSFSEVLLRAQAILRRTSKQSDTHKLVFEDLEMDLIARTVRRSGVAIDLQQKEFSLLECLMTHRDQVLSKTQILEKVWKYDFDPQTNVVDVLVCRLRNKVDKDFKMKLIKTYRGVGYALGPS